MRRIIIAQDAVPAGRELRVMSYELRRALHRVLRMSGALRHLITLLFVFLSFSLFAATIKLQSFENATTDTWAYTANPSSTVPYFWGPTDQPQGGANARSGSWYWASSLMQANEASITFANVPLTAGTQHSLSFYYYSKNLNPATDQMKVCVEYNTGTAWNIWRPLLYDTQAWSLFSVNIPSGVSTVRVKLITKYTNPNMNKFAHWDHFSIKNEGAEITVPIIYNTSITQRTDGSKLVDISYDLFDAHYEPCKVSLKLSSDGGSTFAYTPSPANLNGDIGEYVPTGAGKSILWDAGAEGIDFDGNQYVLRLEVDNHQFPIPANFVLVPGGTFNNGTSDVTLSSFYLDKYELTQAEYQAVMGTNPASGSGVGSNYPVYFVSWLNAIEYCNRRSMQEGLTPCYSYGTYGTNPNSWPEGWDSDCSNHTNVSCNWTAQGYRLPTEMEWMFAARGGIQTHNYTYSGSETLADVAWYSSNAGGNSHPVGGKLANELGLYDMSGNACEWVWDIYYSSYPTDPVTNPNGPTSGTNRTNRGGGWAGSAGACRITTRVSTLATYTNFNLGFRLCRIVP